jgi:hypothetical protein
MRDANDFFTRFKKASSKLVDEDLVKFSSFLLQTCRRDAGELFKQLCNSYGSALNFHDSVEPLLKGPIGGTYFGLREAPNMMSMLQGMLGGKL